MRTLSIIFWLIILALCSAPVYAVDPIFYESFENFDSITAKGGQYAGITLVEGRQGKGVLIKDPGAFLRYPALGNINPQKGTIEFWLKPLWTETKNSAFWGDPNVSHFDFDPNYKEFFNLSGNGAFKIKRECHWNKRNSISTTIEYPGTTSQRAYTYFAEPHGASMAWKPGEWHKVRVFWDFTCPDNQKYLAIAIDDNYILPPTFCSTAFNVTSEFFYIGSNPVGYYPTRYQPNAIIDELKIYDESLLPLDFRNPATKRIPFDPRNPQTETNLRAIFKDDGFMKPFETYNDSPNDCPKLSDSVNPEQRVMFYQKPAFERVVENNIPAAEEIKRILSYQAAKDEYKTLFFNVYSRVDLNNVTVTYSDFRGVNGIISRDNLDLRVVKNWFQGGGYNYEYLPVYVPELLLHNDQIPLETGDWNPHRVPSLPIHDYVKTKVNKFTSKQFVLIAKVPENTPPGNYFADIKLNADGVPEQWVQLNLEVLPFKLQASKKENNIFYGSGNARHYAPQNYLEIMQKEIRDIKNHGFDGMLAYVCGGAAFLLEPTLQIIEREGFKRFVAIAADYDDRFNITMEKADLIKSYGFEPYFRGVDEIGYSDAGLQKQITMSMLIRSVGGKVATTCTKAASDRLDNPLDPIYSLFTPVAYEPLDWAIPSANAATYFYDLMWDRTTKANKPETPYWQSLTEETRINRYFSGYLVWNAKLDGIAPHGYQNGPPNAYNDFVSRNPSSNQRYAALTTYPSQEGPVPTMQWEALREGINDQRYVTTWEYYKDQVKAFLPAIALESENVVNSVLDHYKIKDIYLDSGSGAIRNSMAQYEQDRQTIINEIKRLYIYASRQRMERKTDPLPRSKRTSLLREVNNTNSLPVSGSW